VSRCFERVAARRARARRSAVPASPRRPPRVRPSALSGCAELLVCQFELETEAAGFFPSRCEEALDLFRVAVGHARIVGWQPRARQAERDRVDRSAGRVYARPALSEPSTPRSLKRPARPRRFAYRRLHGNGNIAHVSGPVGHRWFAAVVLPSYARALGEFPDQPSAQRAADEFAHPGCGGGAGCSAWRRDPL
jgi:hypothetical protein